MMTTKQIVPQSDGGLRKIYVKAIEHVIINPIMIDFLLNKFTIKLSFKKFIE